MTTVYVILAVTFLLAFLVFWLVKKSEAKGQAEMREKYLEAEVELREKMAEVDASANVDNPLDEL